MFTESTPHETPWKRVLDALAAPHGIDRYLEWLRPTWTLDQVRATLVRVVHPAPGFVTLHLVPSRSWRGFRAGQHVELSVEIDGVRHTRCYSPAGSAHADGEIELTVRRHAEGRVSAWLHDHARPGQTFDLGSATGDFVLPEPRPARVLLVSGGSGITPMMSMLRTLCDEGHPGPVTLLHYATSPSAVPYATELAELAAAHAHVHVAYVFSEDGHGGELRGHFRREQLEQVEPEWATAEAFVCGPDGLMDAVRHVFEQEGRSDRVHAESFRPLRYRVDPADAKGRVFFERSGVDVENDGRTLLELAEAAGLSPEHGCRRGICHTCACRMSAGRVKNVVTGDIDTHTDVDLQPCIHAAAGDVHIDL